MTRITAVLLTLILITHFVSAQENRSSYEKISAILFPETSSWTLVSQLKHAEEPFLQKVEPQLKKAYLSSNIYKEPQDEMCSFADKIFSKEYKSPDNFYIHDVNLDGIEDIIYSGPSQCSEGHATVIWFGKGKGYEIKQNLRWHVLAIRIKEGDPVQISSVSVGCCGDVLDSYLCGPLRNLRINGVMKVYFQTALPLQTKDSEHFTTAQELVLRSSPETNDQFNKISSEYHKIAVFGNVLSKYLPGCSGRIAGSMQDKVSNLWYFVIMDESSKQLRTHAPFDVCAGWINSDCLKNN